MQADIERSRSKVPHVGAFYRRLRVEGEGALEVPQSGSAPQRDLHWRDAGATQAQRCAGDNPCPPSALRVPLLWLGPAFSRQRHASSTQQQKQLLKSPNREEEPVFLRLPRPV